jgi:Spy/CpxP family protein refolding chaperone
MWRSKMMGVAVAVSLLAPAGFAFERARVGDRGALLERAMDRLELSAEQRSRVEAVLARHRGEVRKDWEALVASREAQYAAVRGQPFDENRIRSAAAAVGAAQADLAVARARIASEVRAILDDGQRARLEEMLEDVRALTGRMRERRARRGR